MTRITEIRTTNCYAAEHVPVVNAVSGNTFLCANAGWHVLHPQNLTLGSYTLAGLWQRPLAKKVRRGATAGLASPAWEPQ